MSPAPMKRGHSPSGRIFYWDEYNPVFIGQATAGTHASTPTAAYSATVFLTEIPPSAAICRANMSAKDASAKGTSWSAGPFGGRTKDIRYVRPKGPMGSMKVILSDDTERRFRRVAMMRYGYGKGALSEAAEAALEAWSSSEDQEVEMPEGMDDPVATIEGMLRNVQASSVELQHDASRIRASKTHATAPD